eukprot:7019257-Heterocapsa_arctica.AAC.1
MSPEPANAYMRMNDDNLSHKRKRNIYENIKEQAYTRGTCVLMDNTRIREDAGHVGRHGGNIVAERRGKDGDM